MLWGAAEHRLRRELAMADPGPTLVLVHGAFADASSMRPLYDSLLDEGVTMLAPPTEVEGASHVVMISHPREVTEVVMTAARTCAAPSGEYVICPTSAEWPLTFGIGKVVGAPNVPSALTGNLLTASCSGTQRNLLSGEYAGPS
jgi:hypothetical protein